MFKYLIADKYPNISNKELNFDYYQVIIGKFSRGDNEISHKALWAL